MDVRDAEGNQVGEEEKIAIYKEHQKSLKKVKDLLEDTKEMEPLETLSIEDQINELCKLADITVDEYKEALKWSYKQYTVTLRRNIEERFINNYNKEWIKAWNGNMDLQICLDFYGVITYITDYATKGDIVLVEALKHAAKQCKTEPKQKQMKMISDTYLHSRSMGESEVCYRLLQELHLTDSNISTRYLATCFPENRTNFMKIVSEDEEHLYDAAELKEINGKKSKYTESPSIIDKYRRRPDTLEKISCMQFAKMYDPINTLPKKAHLSNGSSKETAEETEDLELHHNRRKDMTKIIIHHENSKEMGVEEYRSLLLPRYIELSNPQPGEPKFMRLREHPLAIKQHPINRSKHEHEYLYSELLAYRPFRNESELMRSNQQKCAKLFLEKNDNDEMTKIEKVKTIVMEHLESVLEGKSKAEVILNETTGEMLDAELEQEVDDAELEGVEEHPDYPGLVEPQDGELDLGSWDKSYFRPITLNPPEELFRDLRKLDNEQQLVVQEVLNYAKGIKKFMNGKGKSKFPKPPKLIVQGGAGAGKSTVIKSIIQLTERTLRKEGESGDQPHVLASAPTGTAAAIIDGNTLHHDFNLNFGNDYISYENSIRDLRREQLKNLKLVIIDEFSMVGSDRLYQIDQRLREITQLRFCDFGNVSTFLFGDLLQLPPVKASWIFSAPKSKTWKVDKKITYSPLWRIFDSVILIQNHRQGKDKEYADILNRMRFGKNTVEDFMKLQTRVRSINDPDIPKDAQYICGKRKAVQEINNIRIDGLDGERGDMSAININHLSRTFRPKISEWGTVHETSFMNELHLKVGARVLLVHNVDTSDKLTNGSLGEVLEFNRNRNGDVTSVVVHFYNEKVGKEYRSKNPILLSRFPGKNPVSIKREEFSYSIITQNKSSHASSKAKVIQFPLILAFAATGHKFQGQTIPKPMKVVVDLNTVFRAAQAYVMMSRVEELDQLFILEHLSTKKIYPCQKAMAELERLTAKSMNSNLSDWLNISCLNVFFSERVTFLNTRSLLAHHEDIEHNRMLNVSSLLCVNETWVNADSECPSLMKFSEPHVVAAGPGKGLATYAKHHSDFHHVSDVNKIHHQISCFQSSSTSVISVYRSQSARLTEVFDDLQEILNQCNSENLCLIGGDFNLCALTDNKNCLSEGLMHLGFKQLVEEATHENGRAIDHCYARFPEQRKYETKVSIQSVYWSDHDAITVLIN